MLQFIGSQRLRYDLAAERQRHRLCMEEILSKRVLPCKPLNSTFSAVSWATDITLRGSVDTSGRGKCFPPGLHPNPIPIIAGCERCISRMLCVFL